ncbi:hypothetical protein BC332_01765 [Capsicum chinense]|nr:hypothetical protein BC332_01765 [Capsicum chinense]
MGAGSSIIARMMVQSGPRGTRPMPISGSKKVKAPIGDVHDNLAAMAPATRIEGHNSGPSSPKALVVDVEVVEKVAEPKNWQIYSLLTMAPKVYYHNDEYFLIKFKSIIDRDEVLYSGPHMMHNRPVIVIVWEADFDLNKEVFRIILLWLKLSGIPLSYWSLKSLRRIGSALCKPVYVDYCTTNMYKHGSYFLCENLVIMDITKPLPQSVKLFYHNGRVFEQDILYEQKAIYYVKCLQVGHNCQAKAGRQPNQGRGLKSRL